MQHKSKLVIELNSEAEFIILMEYLSVFKNWKWVDGYYPTSKILEYTRCKKYNGGRVYILYSKNKIRCVIDKRNFVIVSFETFDRVMKVRTIVENLYIRQSKYD